VQGTLDPAETEKHQLTENIMNNMIRNHLGLALAAALTTLSVHAENSPPGLVDFGKFTASASGREFVEVNVKSNLINMIARLAEKEEPSVAEVLRGLNLVRVNVIGLDDQNRDEVEKRVKAIRAQLDTQGWERVVTAQQKNEDVGVYIKTRGGDAVSGVVVTVLTGGKEAVLVNIVGDIQPEKLALVGERLNIEPLKKLGGPFKKGRAAQKKNDAGNSSKGE